MTQAEVRQMFIHNNPGVRRLGKKGYWYRCAHCGKWCGRAGREHAKIPDAQKMEVDHILPWSKGGSDSMHNLQALCKPCNRSKSAKTTFKDDCKIAMNTVLHPIDSVAVIGRGAVRQNKVLNLFGIGTRK